VTRALAFAAGIHSDRRLVSVFVTAPDGLTLHVRRYGSRVLPLFRLCAYLVSPGLQPTFIAWQRLWRPTLASRGVCWRSIIAATANPNMTAIPTTTRFLWALADLSAVIIAKVRTIRLKPVPSGSPKGRRCRVALIALHSKLRAYWRERPCVEKIGTRRHTRSLHGPLAPGGFKIQLV
jgi:hypothetical protein